MKQHQSTSPGHLSPNARAVVRTKRLWGRRRLASWLPLIKELDRFDRAIEDARDTANRRMIICWVLLVILFLASMFVNALVQSRYPFYFCLLVTSACLGFALFFTFRVRFLRSVDMPDDFRETLLPLLEILSEDIPEKKRIRLDIDLSRPDSKKHKVSQKKLPPGNNRKLIETVYRVRGIRAVIPLVSNTFIKLDIVKDYISYDRHYVSARGKYKSKKKWKVLTMVTVFVTPDRAKLMFSSEKAKTLAASEKIKAFRKKGGIACRLRKKFKAKGTEPSVIPASSVDPDEILKMMIALCGLMKEKKIPQESGS